MSMPRQNREARRERVEQRREQILQAAVKVFGRKGYERATIADVAREARLAEGSIYNYFKNKADLLVHIPRLALEPTIEAVKADLGNPAAGELLPPEIMLPRIATAMSGAIRQNAHILRILLSALPVLKQPARAEYMEQVVSFGSGVLETYLGEEIKRGRVDPRLDPHVAAMNFIGLFFPFIMLGQVLQIPDPKPVDYDQVIEQSVRTFLHGVLAPRREGESQ